jgi:hypothetical protein
MSAPTTTSMQPTKLIRTVEPVEAPVLISEQEVVFATAAAIPVSPAKSTPRWIAAVQSLFAGAADPHRRGRPSHPARYAFLEASCMSRAMDRL